MLLAIPPPRRVGTYSLFFKMHLSQLLFVGSLLLASPVLWFFSPLFSAFSFDRVRYVLFETLLFSDVASNIRRPSSFVFSRPHPLGPGFPKSSTPISYPTSHHPYSPPPPPPLTLLIVTQPSFSYFLSSLFGLNLQKSSFLRLSIPEVDISLP